MARSAFFTCIKQKIATCAVVLAPSCLLTPCYANEYDVYYNVTDNSVSKMLSSYTLPKQNYTPL